MILRKNHLLNYIYLFKSLIFCLKYFLILSGRINRLFNIEIIEIKNSLIKIILVRVRADSAKGLNTHGLPSPIEILLRWYYMRNQVLYTIRNSYY